MRRPRPTTALDPASSELLTYFASLPACERSRLLTLDVDAFLARLAAVEAARWLCGSCVVLVRAELESALLADTCAPGLHNLVRLQRRKGGKDVIAISQSHPEVLQSLVLCAGSPLPMYAAQGACQGSERRQQAQEILLHVLAVTVSERLGAAFRAAEERAASLASSLVLSETPSPSSSKGKKKKSKKKKSKARKDAALAVGPEAEAEPEPEPQPQRVDSPVPPVLGAGEAPLTPVDDLFPDDPALDAEVEAFRQRLTFASSPAPAARMALPAAAVESLKATLAM